MGHDSAHSFVSIDYKGKEYSAVCHSHADTITVQHALGHQSARLKPGTDTELLKKLLLREILIEAEKRGELS